MTNSINWRALLAVGSLLVLLAGIAMLSVPGALITGGVIGLASAVADLILDTRGSR